MEKNKKADIPVMVLVIGVFCVCTLALASFFIFDNPSESTTGFDTISIVNSDLQTFYFYLNNGKSRVDSINSVEDVLKGGWARDNYKSSTLSLDGNVLVIKKDYTTLKGKTLVTIKYTKVLKD